MQPSIHDKISAQMGNIEMISLANQGEKK